MTRTQTPSSAGVLFSRAPLIGRELARNELQAVFRDVMTNHVTRAVTIAGTAGMGKTRLLDELLQNLQAEHKNVRVFRESFGTGGGAVRLLRSRFGIAEGADQDVARALLREGITALIGDQKGDEFVFFLGAMLGIRTVDSSRIKAVDDDRESFRRMSRSVLRRFFELDAKASPLVVVFEDLHGASDDTLDFVAHLARTMRDAPCIIVSVARPELFTRRPSWAGAENAEQKVVELLPLHDDQAAELLRASLKPISGDVPEALVSAAIRAAHGSPYLLEQTVRAYFANGTLAEAEDGTWSVNLSKLEHAVLSDTMDDAVEARVRELTKAELDLLEMAAVMGTSFWVGALVALGRIDKPTPALWGGAEDLSLQYRDILAALSDREFVIESAVSTISGEVEFSFTHGLEREKILSLAAQDRITRYHLTVAEWLEFRLAGQVDEYAEMLAGHFSRGGAARKAGHYYLLAGDRARERYSNHVAIHSYQRGLECLGEDDVVARLDTYHHLGDVLQLEGHNDEALSAFRSMLEIAFRLDLKSKGGAAHNRIGRLYRAIGHLDDAMRHLGTGLALFDAANDLRGVGSSLDDIGKVHWMRGTYEIAERFMKKSLEIRQQIGDARSIALSHNNLGLVYQDSGRFSEALEAFEQALEIRREIHDAPGIAQTLNNLGSIHEDNDEHAQAVVLWTEALGVANEVGDRMRQAVILTNIGQAHYRMGDPKEAILVLKQAEALSENLGDRILEGEILRGLAKANMLIDELPVARTAIARSVALFEQAKSKPFLGNALRTQAEILAAAGWDSPLREGARASFLRAVSLFEELGNEVELARSCESYAQFLERDPAPDAAAKSVIETYRNRAAETWKRMQSSEADLAPPISIDFGSFGSS